MENKNGVDAVAPIKTDIPPSAQSAMPGLPALNLVEQNGDAIVSTNFRWTHPDGWEGQTTIRRGANLDDVMENFDVVFGALELLGSQGIKPVTGKKGTPTVPPANQSIPVDFCQIHNVTMKKYDRDNKTWYAHQIDGGGWCNEKDRKAAGYDH